MRVGDAPLTAANVMLPKGTVQSGPAGIVTSLGTTTILFPTPGTASSNSGSSSKSSSTHTSTFGFAYVNEIARESMFGKGAQRFPTGSIIVREKLLAPTAPGPEVLVVMVKREKNFNPRANDWEFLTVSGDIKKIEKREKDGKCQQCHASEAKNDFVFRYPAP